MAIMRLFYSTQLTPALQQIYQYCRTHPHGKGTGTNIGHDEKEEWLNRDIKQNVGAGQTEETVNAFWLQLSYSIIHQLVLYCIVLY